MKVELNKSITERVFQAVLFEIIANIFIILMMKYIIHASTSKSAVLSITSAIIAMLWNIIYNRLFDKVQQSIGFKRHILIRILHAIIFELGLMIILIPAAATWFHISLTKALMLEIAIVLFFLPYTIVFNWLYDCFRNMITS